jgi:hypothetical protein
MSVGIPETKGLTSPKNVYVHFNRTEFSFQGPAHGLVQHYSVSPLILLSFMS